MSALFLFWVPLTSKAIVHFHVRFCDDFLGRILLAHFLFTHVDTGLTITEAADTSVIACLFHFCFPQTTENSFFNVAYFSSI